ncbi:DNA (cytosine-5-)-methyltransferase [Agrobacterium tumefaciens]|nr:DNA (cytosine-5-)-methyltransferase [Agrobacterium tumefaciens]
MKVAGLFAGIGGFEVGLSKSGHEAAFFCELDPAAASILRRRFPGVEIQSDIRTLGSLPSNIDLVTAGFPCQNLSSSGLKAGITGTQSSLVSEVFRLLESRPVEWVLIENVHFMLHLNKGAGMRAVVEGLEQLGYSWAYRLLDTESFGLPQRRRRVFILASLNHDPRNVLLSEDAPAAPIRELSIQQPVGFYWTEGTYATGLAANSVPPLKGGSTIGIPSPPAIMMPDGLVGTPDIRDAERLQGFAEDWTNDPAVGRSSFRWRLIGNAVSVNVSAWLGSKLASPDRYDHQNDDPISSDEWPNAAWNVGGGKYKSRASSRPLLGVEAGLGDFLRHPLKPLSAKATSGFLKRARKGNLKFPEGFLIRLDRHLKHCA